MLTDTLRPYGRGGRWTQRSTTPELLLPRLATSVTLAPHATTAWSWGAYVQLTASTAADFYPHSAFVQITVTQLTTGIFFMNLELEIATGAAGSEVPYANLPEALVATMSLASANPAMGFSKTYPIGPSLIPSGTRVAARLRHDLAGDVDMYARAALYVGGYEPPAPGSDPIYPLDEYLAGANTPQTKHTPQGSTLSVGTGTYGAGWGSWVQVFASAAVDTLVHGVAAAQVSPTQGKHLQFGIGAAGSEVPYALLGLPIIASILAGEQRLRRPLLVKAGERLAVRCRGGSGSAAIRVYYEEL